MIVVPPANVRSGPGMSYSIPGGIVKGATFQISRQTENGYTGANY